MIQKIISGIFKLLIGLVSVIFSPIDNYIMSNIPALANVLTSINGLFNYATTYIGYIKDMLLLENYTIDLLIAYATFYLSAPLVFNAIKVAVKWYNSLKI